MNLYYELIGKPVFNISDLKQYYTSEGAARSALKRLLKSGQVLKIRQNMYTCKNGKNGGPIANRFQIASAVTTGSFVSHHSAMEYYGITDQVFYEVYVGSSVKFRDFEFDGYRYRCVISRFKEGVVKPEFSGGISVSDRERTVVDCIKDMDKIAGMEETVSDLSSVKLLDEKKLLLYLEQYDNQFLYQKTGFLLSREGTAIGLSADFFKICHGKVGKSKRYLTSDFSGKSYYDSEWQLVVPETISLIKPMHRK